MTALGDHRFAPGELCLLIGATGSGRSTLLRSVDPGDGLLRAVPQRVTDGFGGKTVQEEMARALRNLQRSPDALSRRTEQLLEPYGLADLRERRIDTLSAGQQQAVGVIAALAAEPDVLLLDEPTSCLDPVLGEQLVAAVQTFADTGATVLLAEHRLERVAAYAHTALTGADHGPIAEVLSRADLVPPVVALSRLLRWSPVALRIEDAWHAAATHPLPSVEQVQLPDDLGSGRPRDVVAARAEHLHVAADRPGGGPAISDVTAAVNAGEVVAVMGGAGSGKSTLLHCLAGLRRPQSGVVTVGGHDPGRLSRRDRADTVGLLPADPADLLLAGRVDTECAAADRATAAPTGRTAAILADLLPGVPADRHPRRLSMGQQTALGLAILLARAPGVLLLDEPTRGLDSGVKARLSAALRALSAAGHAVVVATHDVEFAAGLADRVVLLNGGNVTADAPTSQVLTRTPGYCTQVAQIMAPATLLTVDEVGRALLSSAGW